MIYEELHQRYGNHIAKRVMVELSVAEFRNVLIEDLTSYLDTRADIAHKEYQSRLDNPFINEELGSARKDYLDVLCRRWREAEDLAYLVTIARDISVTSRQAMASSQHA